MLKLRRGEVIQRDPLVVRVAGENRRAWADPALVGEVLEGDRVIVNIDARRGGDRDHARHELWVRPAPIDEYAQSGLPSTTMGREIADDRLFFATAVAAGDGLAAAAVGVGSPG